MTPAYIFDLDVFSKRIAAIKAALPEIPLVYSIKANPFLLPYLPKEITHIEVCSPGELAICRELKASPEKIIYSGVVKEETDITEALSYGADIITAESIRHYELIKEAAKKLDKKVKLLLRLSSGNQFGMSEEDMVTVIGDAAEHENIKICGVHYYSGTAKKAAQIEEDIKHLDAALDRLKSEASFKCELLEYGPGLAAEYFAADEDECEKKDMELLEKTAPMIRALSERHSLSIEMGRFMASSCGCYETAVMDIKHTDGVDYILVDGGTHHMKYYGPNAAMKVPVVKQESTGSKEDYTICGSLCTTADVLVRNITLHEVRIGDTLRFMRTGAYCVTEGTALFLSRRMPAVYVTSKKTGKVCVRKEMESYPVNQGQSGDGLND